MELQRPLEEVLRLLGGGDFLIGKTAHRHSSLGASIPLQNMGATIHQDMKAMPSLKTSEIGPFLQDLSKKWKRAIILIILPNKMKGTNIDNPTAYPSSKTPYVDSSLWSQRIGIITLIKHRDHYHFVQFVNQNTAKSFLTLEDLLEANVYKILETTPKDNPLYKNLGNILATIYKRLPPSVKSQFAVS